MSLQVGDYVRLSGEGNEWVFKVIAIRGDSAEIVQLPDGNKFQIEFIPEESLFRELPNEIVFEIGLRLGVNDLVNLCQTSKRANLIFCKDDPFWQRKFLRDFRDLKPGVADRPNWKERYKTMVISDLFMFGAAGTTGLPIVSPYQTTPIQLPGISVKTVSAGYFYTMVVDLDHSAVWGFGSNNYGQLGLGYTGEKEIKPVRLPGSFRAKDISVGNSHTVVISLDDSTVWTCGNNSDGQLGLGDYTSRSTLTQVPGLRAKAIAAGGEHTIVIDFEGTVWAFGANHHGQLGLDGDRRINKPVQIPNLRAKAVSAGLRYTILIGLDDTVWVFGNNTYGQLGLSGTTGVKIPRHLSETLRAKAVSAGMTHAVIIKLDGGVIITGSSGPKEFFSYVPPKILEFKAKAAAAGRFFTLLIALNDTVWSFGRNEHGQLGLGDRRGRETLTQIPGLKGRVVSAGSFHSAIIGKSRVLG